MKIISKIQSTLSCLFTLNGKDYTKFYSIDRKSIGSGGNAIVKTATRNNDNQKIAIKILKDDAKLSKEKVLRFKDEIQIMCENAPYINGIMPILDYSISGCWYTMPVAEAIKEHIDNGNNHIETIVDGILELTETLIQLHNKGLSHRDIKPDNIFFLNDRYYLGDFGLVDIPDNPNNLTENGNRIGAKYTIAPEMFRNTKTADGKKADVYSLAKTLWMLLKENYKGFDGRYDFMDRSISLHSSVKFHEIHLVGIDELLVEATQNTPEDRPSMLDFRDKLIAWKDTYNDDTKIQRSNWNFINRYIFTSTRPSSCHWDDVDDIIKILNIISCLPAYNYMIFSDRGGLDFQLAEKANEDGCMYVYATGMCFLVKPKRLYLEVFNESDWNYFLLELSTQDPALDKTNTSAEYLVEDTPAHYVSAQYAQYGVYDYDSGEKFPQGYKIVNRYINGKFLIIPKFGPYNSISSIVDGRHGDCNAADFNKYVRKIKRTVESEQYKMHDRENVLNRIFNFNPFKIDTEIITDEFHHSKSVSHEFIKDNYANFCFKELVNKFTSENTGNIAFYYEFHKDFSVDIFSIFNPERLYLCKDGYIRSTTEEDKDIFMIYDRNTAIKFSINLDKKLAKICGVGDDDRIWAYFSVSLRRIGNPKHLFTKAEIESLMRNADDRFSNVMVIDEDGYAHIINQPSEGEFYPLRHETWCAGNVYVGKYSRLGDLNETYQYSLEKWAEYLETNRRATFADYVSYSKSEEDLIKEINTYYK